MNTRTKTLLLGLAWAMASACIGDGDETTTASQEPAPAWEVLDASTVLLHGSLADELLDLWRPSRFSFDSLEVDGAVLHEKVESTFEFTPLGSLTPQRWYPFSVWQQTGATSMAELHVIGPTESGDPAQLSFVGPMAELLFDELATTFDPTASTGVRYEQGADGIRHLLSGSFDCARPDGAVCTITHPPEARTTAVLPITTPATPIELRRDRTDSLSGEIRIHGPTAGELRALLETHWNGSLRRFERADRRLTRWNGLSCIDRPAPTPPECRFRAEALEMPDANVTFRDGPARSLHRMVALSADRGAPGYESLVIDGVEHVRGAAGLDCWSVPVPLQDTPDYVCTLSTAGPATAP